MALHSNPSQPGVLHIATVPQDAGSAWHWQPLQLAEDPAPDVVARTLSAMSFQTLKARTGSCH